MTAIKNKLENSKDKIVGKTKEVVGKATGNEKLELKGKLQSKKGELKSKIANVKDKVVGKINDILDEKKKGKQK